MDDEKNVVKKPIPLISEAAKECKQAFDAWMTSMTNLSELIDKKTKKIGRDIKKINGSDQGTSVS